MLIIDSINDSIIKYLDVFDLSAEVVKVSSSFAASIKEFKKLNPELEQGKLLDFDNLSIIEFKK